MYQEKVRGKLENDEKKIRMESMKNRNGEEPSLCRSMLTIR